MMAFFVPVGIAAGWLAGGRLRGMRLAFDWPLLPLLAYMAELLLPKFAPVPAFLPQALLYGLLLVFFGRNCKRGAWVWLAGGGTLLNGLVIALNGWRMPVAAAALAGRGDLQAALSAGAIAGYTLAGSGTRLPFLGDLLRVLPGAGPFFGLASVGDLLMGAGVVLVMVRMMTAQKRAQRGAGRQPS